MIPRSGNLCRTRRGGGPRAAWRGGRLATAMAAVVLSAGCAAGGGSGGGGGFGAGTQGGAGQPVARVQTLADSGPGSLREAIAMGRRNVVFDVAGTIDLQSDLVVGGPYLTIDGNTSPGPGITIRQAGLRIAGGGVHDVIVRGVRIRSPGSRSSEGDGITVKNDVFNVLIENVSVDGCRDGNIDITRGAHDVTVRWSILSSCAKNMLINYDARRISIHHNVFVRSQYRNPNISNTDERADNAASDITADVRNNLIWGWGSSGGGTILQCGAKANVIGNFYSSPNTSRSRQANAIVDDGCRTGSPALFHTSGNVSRDNLPFDLNAAGNTPMPFPAPPGVTESACVAASGALVLAGAQPRDGIDGNRLGGISIPGC